MDSNVSRSVRVLEVSVMQWKLRALLAEARLNDPRFQVSPPAAAVEEPESSGWRRGWLSGYHHSLEEEIAQSIQDEQEEK